MRSVSFQNELSSSWQMWNLQQQKDEWLEVTTAYTVKCAGMKLPDQPCLSKSRVSHWNVSNGLQLTAVLSVLTISTILVEQSATLSLSGSLFTFWCFSHCGAGGKYTRVEWQCNSGGMTSVRKYEKGSERERGDVWQANRRRHSSAPSAKEGWMKREEHVG